MIGALFLLALTILAVSLAFAAVYHLSAYLTECLVRACLPDWHPHNQR